MVGPFTDKYVRYILCWLLFGLFGFTYLIQFSLLFALASVSIAFFLTVGLDFGFRQIIRQKAFAMVNEEPRATVQAYRQEKDKRGYLVLTDNYLLFVPLFGKIRTVLKGKEIVRKDVNGLTAEFTAKFPNQYQNFTFFILTKQKFVDALEKTTDVSVPYKQDELEKKGS
ncbi:hypothetical protein [Alteribacter populi]|uniref:hypothetical protein n=1 Tax=Alteribacter populi TaxID=2011011 RepID=UPI000BBB1F44|nr:hypothetical protein [Alteribacter populi]